MKPIFWKWGGLVAAVVVGLFLPVAVKAAPGAVLGWGLNSNGQAVPPSPLTNLLSVAAGASHSLGLTAEGTVAAWGDNSSGQCSPPAGLNNVIAVAAGALHSLALKSDGTVVAWGDNASGQTNVLGGLNNAQAIAAGGLVSMALRTDGSVAVWGEPAFGQTIVPVSATNVSAIAAGGLHCLALRSNGTVVAWGANTSSQTNVPVAATNVIAIAAGQNHSLALRSNGTVLTWGFGTAVPPTLTGAIAITAGFSHSLALRTNGAMVAWGNNTYGQVTLPTGLTNVTSIAAGGSHSLALTSVPYVLNQPQNLTASEGGNAVLTVSVLSSSSLGYQWYYNGTTITGATQSSLVLSNVQADQSGSYYAWVTNSAGQVVTTPAVLKVGPLIPGQPTNQTADPGDSASFMVTTASTYPLSYQWQWNGANLPGQTGSSLSLTNVQAENAGEYRVVVSIPSGSITSSPAFLLVNTSCLPVPSGLIGWWQAESNTLNFASEAHGSFPGNYQPGKVGKAFAANLTQWITVPDEPILNPTNAITVEAWVLFTDAPYSGMSIVTKGDVTSYIQYGINKLSDGRFFGGVTTATGGALAYGTTRALASRWYHVALTYDSNFVRLYVNGRLETSSPANGPISISSYPVYMGVSFTGLVDEPSLYDRALNPEEILAIYNADASGKCAGPLAPSILTPPASQTPIAGSDVTLSTIARGSPPLFYQWTFNGIDIPAANNSQHLLPNVQAANNGSFRVVVSNAFGSATSAPAALLVQSAGPIITQQPANRLGLLDQSAALEVGYWGSQPLSLQWYFNGARLAGATNSSLNWAHLSYTNAGDYWVVLTNSQGSVTSLVAHLTVLSSPFPAAAARGWGENSYGQINFSASATNIVMLTGSDKTTLGLRADGTIWAPALPPTGINVPPGLSNVVAIDASDSYSLALKSDGKVVAWGTNPNGELNIPPDLSNVIAIAANGSSPIALKSDGTVVGWGGPFGTPPPGLSNVVAIASGPITKLALKSDGTITGWALQSFVEIPPGLTEIQAVAAGNWHCLALRSNGTVVAWGRNNVGQTNVPAGLSGVAAIAAGFDHCLALKSNGVVVAWGATNSGQCTIPNGLSNAISIAAGNYYSLAATRGPSIYAHPVAATTTLGSNVSFSVTAVGEGILSYQWKLNGNDISGATNALLALTGVQTNQAGVYNVRVSSPYGFADSAGASLLVNLPHPADGGLIVDNPAATVVGNWPTVGGGLRYGPNYYNKSQGGGAGRVTFVPNLPLTGGYQVFEWHPQSAVNAALHAISYDGGQQTMKVNQATNSGKWNLLGVFKFAAGTNGSVSVSDLFPQTVSAFVNADAMSFTYVPLPVIDSQPVSQTADPGGVAQFSVAATSQTPLSFQWRFQSLDLPNATNSTLVITNLQSGDAGDYSVAVSNISGTVLSATAQLRVGGLLDFALSGSQMTLSWSGPYVLQSSTNAAGPYLDLPGTSPYLVDPASGSSMFFRLRFNQSLTLRAPRAF